MDRRDYKVEYEGMDVHTLWRSGIARKFTDDQKKDLVIQALSANFMELGAANAVGWSKEAMRKHRHQDSSFDERCRMAQAHGQQILHTAIMQQIFQDPEALDGRLALAYYDMQLRQPREEASTELRIIDTETRKEDQRKRKAEADITEKVAELATQVDDDTKLKRLEAVTKGLAAVAKITKE